MKKPEEEPSEESFYGSLPNVSGMFGSLLGYGEAEESPTAVAKQSAGMDGIQEVQTEVEHEVEEERDPYEALRNSNVRSLIVLGGARVDSFVVALHLRHHLGCTHTVHPLSV